MDQPISYGHAPQDHWISGALTTPHQPSLPQHDLRMVRWFVWEDPVDVLFVETLTAIETCSRLLTECAFNLQTMERRLYSLQQTRRQAYVVRTTAAQLSKRELQVLDLVARNLSNQAIGTELGISPGTVKNHVTSILAKLAVHRRQDAVMKAQSLGLI